MTKYKIRENFRAFPKHHRFLILFCILMISMQGVYLSRFLAKFLYSLIVFEVPYEEPKECEYREDNYGPPPLYIEGGGVEFNVDMRCFSQDRPGALLDVYVTGPFCGNCSSEGWNTLSDLNGDGIYRGSINFTKEGPNKPGDPLFGAGILYRYAANFRGLSPEDRWYRVEDLTDDISNGAKCAVTEDSIGGLRAATTEAWPIAVWDIFGSCTNTSLSKEEADHIWEANHKELNPWVAARIDPWYRPLMKVLEAVCVIDPTFFLTLCSGLYVGSVVIVGFGYSKRKEKSLLDMMERLQTKSTYLEHAAKILRHDMNSGINIYLPRAVKSITKRLDKNPKVVEDLRLGPPLKMLVEGLNHTQRVYQGITDFTDIVRDNTKIKTELICLSDLLRGFFDGMAYADQVVIEDLPEMRVNANLFCTAIDNLVRNGLKYNDSPTKLVVVKMIDAYTIGVIDNGRGLTQEDFLVVSKAWVRKQGQKEQGSGLGLNICIAILKEHGFVVSSELREGDPGTIIKIQIW